MIAVARFGFVLALAVWVGETVFLSFVVAPTLFGHYPVHEAGAIMAALFPGYYGLGYACGIVLIVCTWILSREAGGWKWPTALSAVMLAATLYAGLGLQPRIRELRIQRQAATVAPEVEREFDRLHRRSVQLNAFVLLAGLALVGAAAARVEP